MLAESSRFEEAPGGEDMMRSLTRVTERDVKGLKGLKGLKGCTFNLIILINPN